jgi:Uma2 family endonuclease
VKAVMLEVDPNLLEHRRRLGLDHHDEMWEGVLHMTPAPANEHQRMLDELLVFLVPLLRRTARGSLRSGINVFDETAPKENYRIPDLTFVAAGRESLFAEDGIRGGGPDAVIEIRSPNDESYEKLPFFLKLGVREALIIDRDTKRVDLFASEGGEYVRQAPDAAGIVMSNVLRVRFRTIEGTRPRLVAADADDPRTQAEI